MKLEEPKLPRGATKDSKGRVYNSAGELIEVFEVFEGQWRVVVDGSRFGWWRFHEHYDRNGYCDNPGRGY